MPLRMTRELSPILFKSLIQAGLCMLLVACGGSGATISSPDQTENAQPGLSLIAGQLNGSAGPVDGVAENARFAAPALVVQGRTGTAYVDVHKGLSSIVADKVGNLYVGDAGLRKITRQGDVVTLVSAPQEEMRYLAVDSAGNIFFTFGASIQKASPSGVVTPFLTGTAASGAQVPESATQPFYYPGPIAFDVQDRLYVSDGRFIRRVTADGKVELFAALPNESGATTGMAIDSKGSVFLAQSEVLWMPSHAVLGKFRSRVLKAGADGVVTNVAGFTESGGHADGPASMAMFNGPTGIAVDAGGNVYVADSDNHVIRKIAKDGTVSTIAGTPAVDRIQLGQLPGRLSRPVGLVLIGERTLALTSGAAVLKLVLP